MIKKIGIFIAGYLVLYVLFAWILSDTTNCLAGISRLPLTCEFGLKLRYNPWP